MVEQLSDEELSPNELMSRVDSYDGKALCTDVVVDGFDIVVHAEAQGIYSTNSIESRFSIPKEISWDSDLVRLCRYYDVNPLYPTDLKGKMLDVTDNKNNVLIPEDVSYRHKFKRGTSALRERVVGSIDSGGLSITLIGLYYFLWVFVFYPVFLPVLMIEMFNDDSAPNDIGLIMISTVGVMWYLGFVVVLDVMMF